MKYVSLAQVNRLLRRFGFLGLLRSLFHRYLGRKIAQFFPRKSVQAVGSFLTESNNERTIVMVSTLDWFFPFRQRVHHLATTFSRLGWKVIFCLSISGL